MKQKTRQKKTNRQSGKKTGFSVIPYLKSLRKKAPLLWKSPGKFIKLVFESRVTRYLLAGAWNTFFGWFSFALLYKLLSANIHYIVISAISGVICITMSYFTYKVFVFRTKGGILKEYFKAYLVYGGTYLLGLVLLPFFVEILKFHPYLGQAFCIIITVIVSYLGHSRFTFRRK